MRKIIFLVITVIFTYSGFAQDAKQILQKAYVKCQTIKNGYYEMTSYMKYMSRKDTTVTQTNCAFQKVPNNSIFPLNFRYESVFDSGKRTSVFNSDTLFTFSTKNDTGTIVPVSKYPETIKSIIRNYHLYSPFTSLKSEPLFPVDEPNSMNPTYKWIGNETINGEDCQHIQVNKLPQNNEGSPLKTILIEFHFWINEADSIPVQYIFIINDVMGTDTMSQYQKFLVGKYEFNNLYDKNYFTQSSIPSYIKFRDYVPYKVPELLPVDTKAPEWELISTNNETINLRNLQGKLVLIDFFYKSCYPCLQALPDLHEKYNGKGLQIVGIDPYDTTEDEMPAFLSKRGITYPVLLGGKEVAKMYHVSGYPTVYIIDKKGTIIYVQPGYGNDTEREIENIIKENLDIK